MKLALISDGTQAGTKVVGRMDTDGAELPIEDVIGVIYERAYDNDARPLPYMLLNVTVRIEEESETLEPADS